MNDKGPTATEIRSVFRRPVVPQGTTQHYRIRLASVLLGLAILQFLYLLLIAAVVTLTIVYTRAMVDSRVPANLITLVFYIGGPATGCISVLFLLKPIIIRPPHPPRPIWLTREREPKLFEFIDYLCEALGSPYPSRIYADLRVNASAAVQGWRGLFLGNFDLTIGLPLATGLTLTEFTGVLAHEFGHFAQRTGLRSYFLIQTMQEWFSRVVYQRDSWDSWLERMRDRRDWRIKAIAHLAQLVVNGSRIYLTSLMKAGRWISTGFSRQMEFDADCREVAITGAEIFERTTLRMPILECAATLAWQDVAKEWSVRRLPEDFAALVSIRAEFLPDEIKDKIKSEALTATTGRWDTHPCPSERLANIQRMDAPGIFDLDGAADTLFGNLSAICREATQHHYTSIFGIPAGAARLVPTPETFLNALAAREFDQAAAQLFNAAAEFWSRWFRLPEADPRPHEITSGCSSAPKLTSAAFDSALEMSLLHFAALTIAQSSVRVKAESFRLNASDLKSVREEEQLSRHNLNEMLDEYNRSNKQTAERIETTVALLFQGEWGIPVQEDRQIPIPDLNASWRSYGDVSSCQSEILEVRRRLCAARVVRQNARLFPAATCANLLEDLEQEALSKIDQIANRCSDTPSAISFDDRSPATVGAQLRVTDGSATERIEAFLSRFEALSTRTLAHLAWFTVKACPLPADDGNKSRATASA